MISAVLERKTPDFPLYASNSILTEMAEEPIKQKQRLSLWECQLLFCHVSICGPVHINDVPINKLNYE